MDSDTELTEVQEVGCTSIRSRVSAGMVSGVITSSSQESMERIAPLGGPSGPLFRLYHHLKDNGTGTDCGWLFEGEFHESEGVRLFTLPGGKVAKARHIRPYGKPVDTYARSMGFIKRNGLIPGTMWEYHLNDPLDTPKKNRSPRFIGVYIES